MRPELITIPNVEIVSTGIEYPLMSGPATFTEADLRDLVESQSDPAIRAPRIKLGHIDPRFNGPEFDATPAYGVVKNMSLGNNNQSVFGDLVGVPQWLADIMPVAYPSRSIEASVGVTTVTGKKWSLVLTALSLLGVMMPGVSVIEDLANHYGSDMPEGVVLAEGGAMADLAAAINVDDVRRQYYDGLEANQMWWWIRAIELDPSQLIVDDDDGKLFRVPFSVNGEEASFDDPVEVKINYVDVAQAQARLARIYASRAESRGDSMNERELQLRRDLGLPETATDDQVTARIQQLRATEGPQAPTPQQPPPGTTAPTTPPPAEPTPEEEGAEDEQEEETPTTPEEQGEGQGQGTGQEVNAGVVTLDAAAYQRLMRGAEAGLRAETARVAAENTSLLDAAVREGKFPPARLSFWEQYLKADPEGAKQAIASLSPGLIPVNERGSSAVLDGQQQEIQGLPDSWFPEIAARKIAAASGARVTRDEG